jgi:uncharacterized protein (TIGR02118 family)
MLEFVFLGEDLDAARRVAQTGATVYVDRRLDIVLPFRTVTRVVSHDLGPFAKAATVGTYVVFSRLEMERSTTRRSPATSSLVTVNAFVRRPGLSHSEADTHWRLSHVPLVRRHHPGVVAYHQLSVAHVIAGPEYDGFAVCEFDSIEDFRDRFFDSPEGRAAILADVATLADPDRSPRRIVGALLQPD